MNTTHDIDDLLQDDGPIGVVSIPEIIQKTPREALTADVVRAFRRLIGSAVQVIGREHMRKERMTLEAARAVEERSRAECEENHRRLTLAEKELEDAPRASVIQVVVHFFCAVAGFVAEFALTWKTLPYILSIPQMSPVGILLAVAPATVLVVLDVVFLRLLEGPWQRKSTAGRWDRRVRVALMVAFMAAVAVLNLYMVLTLADAREEAGTLHRILTQGSGNVVVNTILLHRAIRAVSVTVAVAGAIFLLLGLQGCSRIARRLHAQRTVNRLQRALGPVALRLDKARVRRAALEDGWPQQALERCHAQEEFDRDRWMVVLQDAQERKLPPKPDAEVVDEVLSRVPGVTEFRRLPFEEHSAEAPGEPLAPSTCFVS